jgi:FtsZ-binding cell division protein ZapB
MSRSLKSSDNRYSIAKDHQSDYQVETQTNLSSTFNQPIASSTIQLQETINFLLLQLKEEKEKRVSAEDELSELKKSTKKPLKIAMPINPQSDKQLNSLKKQLSDSNAIVAGLQQQLLHIQADYDRRLTAAIDDYRRAARRDVEAMQATVDGLRLEIVEIKRQNDDLKMKVERGEAYRGKFGGDGRGGDGEDEELDESRLTAEIHYGESGTLNDSLDIEVPRRMDSDKTFEYTPQKPKYIEGIEFPSPSRLKPETNENRKSSTFKSPNVIQNLPLKSTIQRISDTVSELNELEKLKSENKKLHEHLRKLLNRPSNLSASTSPSHPTKSKSPLIRHQPKTIDLEQTTSDMLAINPTLNIIRINDSTVQVNKRRLTLAMNGVQVCVKVKDKCIPVKDYVKQSWPYVK